MTEVSGSLESRLRDNPIIIAGRESGLLRTVVGNALEKNFRHVVSKYSLADAEVALDQLLNQEVDERPIEASLESIAKIFCQVTKCEDDPQELADYISNMNNWTSLWFLNTFGEVAREVSGLNPFEFYHKHGPKKMFSNIKYVAAGFLGKTIGAKSLFWGIKQSSKNLTDISIFDYKEVEDGAEKIKEQLGFPSGLNGPLLRVSRTRLPDILERSKEVYKDHLQLALDYDSLRTEGVLLYGASALGDYGYVKKAPEECSLEEAVFYAAFPTVLGRAKILCQRPRDLVKYVFDKVKTVVWAYPKLKLLTNELDARNRDLLEQASELVEANRRADTAERRLQRLDFAGFRHDAVSSVRDGFDLHQKTIFTAVCTSLFAAYQQSLEGNETFKKYVSRIDEELDIWFLEDGEDFGRDDLENILSIRIAERPGRLTKTYEEVVEIHNKILLDIKDRTPPQEYELLVGIFSPLDDLLDHRRMKTERIADFSQRGKEEENTTTDLQLRDLLSRSKEIANAKLSGEWILDLSVKTNYTVKVKAKRVFVDNIYDLVKNCIEAGASEVKLQAAEMSEFPYLETYKDFLEQDGAMPAAYVCVKDNGRGYPHARETTEEINNPSLGVTNRSTRAQADSGGKGTENLQQLITTEFHQGKLKGLYHINRSGSESGTEFYLFFYSTDLTTLS